MNFRHLKPTLIRFLDDEDEEGQTRWPKYRSLGTYARRNRWVFSEREYSRLKRVHVGVEGLAVTLIQYLHDVKGASLLREFPELTNQGPDELIEKLTEFSDGKNLRRHDYLRGVSWHEWALLHALRDDDGESESFCRNEELARQVARAQYLEMGRALVPRRRRNDEGVVVAALESQTGLSLVEFEDMTARFWLEVPECVWLNVKRRQPIGGSIVVPLTQDAYAGLAAGRLSDRDLSPETDLQFPSRHLWVAALTTFPNVTKPRLPGVHTARMIRKLFQNCAILLRHGTPQESPVKMLIITDDDAVTRAILRLGYKRLEHPLHGTQSPLYELVMPPPETTIADFSSAAATGASIMGTAWRLLRPD